MSATNPTRLSRWGLAALTGLTALYLSGAVVFVWPRAAMEREAGWPALVWAAMVVLGAHRGIDPDGVPLIGHALRFLRALDRPRLVALAALFVLGWGGFAVRRYDAFEARAYDLAIFDQAIWATAQGRYLFSSLKGDIVLLGDHASPILAAVAPLYRVFDDVRALLWLQAAALAYGAFPIHRLARRFLGPGAFAALFPVAYLLQSPLRILNLNEFHPEAFAVPVLLLALEALLDERWLRVFLCGVLAIACKETTALAVVGLGLVAIGRRSLRAGLLLMAFGAGAFAFDVLWVIPRFLGHSTSYVGRYEHLGSSFSQVLSAPLRHPLQVAAQLVWPGLKIEGWARLLCPYGFSALASPAVLLGALPNYLVNAMSSYPSMWSVAAQYHAEEMAFAAFASIAGAARILGRWPARRRWIAGAVATAALAQTGLPVAAAWARLPISERARWGNAQLAALPADLAVSADTASATHLAHRMKLFHFPNRLDEADCAVVDTHVVDHPWHVTPERSRETIARLPLMGFETRAERDGWIIACLRRPRP